MNREMDRPSHDFGGPQDFTDVSQVFRSEDRVWAGKRLGD